MTTQRQRRAGANPPLYAIEHADDRVYTEEDYAEKAAPEDTLPDEWATRRSVYASAGWTSESALTDEAFQPDEDELPDEAEWAEEEDSLPYRILAQAYDEPYADDDDTSGEDPLSEDLLTEDEQAELRRSRWQLIANLSDFAGVIVGTAVILVLVMLLISLVNWLVNDLNQSFILLQKNF